MNTRWTKLTISGIAALSLLLPVANMPAGQVYAAAAQQQTLSGQIVKLGANATLSIRDAQILMQDQGRMLSFTALITNNGSSELNLIDYWVKVKTKSGKTFKVTMTDADKNKKTIPAKTSSYITYYAAVDNSTDIKDIVFEMIKWDFSLPNYERSLGKIQVPGNSSTKIAPFKDKTMVFNNSKIRGALKQYFVTKDSTTTYVTLNYLVENVGYQATDLSNLNFFIQTDGMSVYTVTSNSSGVSIQPKERKIVSLQASIPNAVSSKALSLVVANNDEADKLQLPIGLFAIPTLKTASATPVNTNKQIFLSDQAINTKASAAIIDSTGENTTVSLDYTLHNNGTSAVKDFNLEFYIQTPNGALYPLSYQKSDSFSLLPQIDQTVNLAGEIPAVKDNEQLKLVVKTAATDKLKSGTIGIYQIKSSNQQGSTYTNNDYTITLKSIRRLPSNSNDILMANLTVTNPSNLAKANPNYTGYFIIDGIKINADAITAALDQTISLAPKGTYNFVVYSKIPYTTKINNVAFVLSEKGDSKTADKALFKFTGTGISDAPTYSIAKPYEISTVGKQSEVRLLTPSILTGMDQSEYFYMEMVMSNLEGRYAQFDQLTAYLEDTSGTIVPMTLDKSPGAILPGGKALLRAIGKIPANFDKEHYKLYLGQALEGAASSSSSDGNTNSNSSADDVMVNPVSYKFDTVGTLKTDDFKNISVNNYNLSISDISANIKTDASYNYSGVKLGFTYKLSKDDSYQVVPADQKIVVEFVDQGDAKATYDKELSLKPITNSTDFLQETEDTDLTITYDDENLSAKIQRFDTYKLNIYSVIGDTKLLIASKELKWFYPQN